MTTRLRILVKYWNFIWKYWFRQERWLASLKKNYFSRFLSIANANLLAIFLKNAVNIQFKGNALGESDILRDPLRSRPRNSCKYSFPKEESREPRIVCCETRPRRDGLSSLLSRSKEMERKLIEAVNVNTRMDVRDRKSGLVNWLTVSPLYFFSDGKRECAFSLFFPLRRPSPPETVFSPSRSFAALFWYLLRFLSLTFSLALFRFITERIERSYAVRSCIWPAI